MQEFPNWHVLFGIVISGRDRLTEVGDGGNEGPGCAQIRFCCYAVLDQNVTVPLDCRGGGWSNTGNLKNMFEDKTNCFAVWGFFCRLLPNLGA